MFGYESIGKQGDYLYIPANLQVLGKDKETDNKSQVIEELKLLKKSDVEIAELIKWL